MLRLTLFSIIVRLIPESLVFIFGCYVFSNKELNIKPYLISSLLLGISILVIRMLPIHYGVHTILNIMVMNVILYTISKINIMLAIKSSLITTMCLFILEGINMIALKLIFKEQLESIMLNTNVITILGLPSLMCFTIIVVIYYYLGKNANVEYF